MRWVLVLVAACKSPPTPPPPAIGATSDAPSLGQVLDRAKQRSGDVLLASTDEGIVALTPELERIALVTKTHGEHVHVDNHVLYFFVRGARQVVRLDLDSGREQVLATLPAIRHRCFGDDGDGADPIQHIESAGDEFIDPRRGVACVIARDRNENMMSVEVQFRIDLATGKLERAVTSLDSCLEPGDRKMGDDRPDLCGPGHTFELPPHEGRHGWGTPSPSKRWDYLASADLGEQGDYIYAAAFVADNTTDKVYAIQRDKLVPVDLERARQNQERPPDTCLLPGEAYVRWLDHTDALVVDGCGDGAILVRPPATVKKLDGTSFALY